MPRVSWRSRLQVALRHPRALAWSIFLAFSALWTVADPLISLVHPKWLSGFPQFLLILALGVLLGFVARLPKLRVDIPVKNISTRLQVVFGDLFDQAGDKAISVGEFFDSELGPPVSPESLHGIFIQRMYNGQSKGFEQSVDRGLESVPYEQVQRQRGRTRRYPIGTTSVVTGLPGDARYYLFALCHANPQTLKAEADVPDLWLALSGLWDAVRVSSGGRDVNVPLVGSGLAQMRLPAQQLLRIMLMSVVAKAKSAEITSGTIRIVVHPSKFGDVDIDSLWCEWS